jgi:two-component system nitrate/nitrite response regulator NarL
MMLSALIIDRQQVLGREAREVLFAQLNIVGNMDRLPNGEHLHKATNPDLLIACIGNHADFKRDLMTICEIFPSTKIVVIASRYDASECSEAIRSGAAAYLLNDMSPLALLAALSLAATEDVVLLAGRRLGAAAPNSLTPIADCTSRTVAASSRSDLSPREVTILDLVKRGDSNKHIARKLGIAEATVKCHVKAILRKINVRNRFDAAMWALRADEFERQKNAARLARTEGVPQDMETRSRSRGRNRASMQPGLPA